VAENISTVAIREKPANEKLNATAVGGKLLEERGMWPKLFDHLIERAGNGPH
jgi:hypothetical protein